MAAPSATSEPLSRRRVNMVRLLGAASRLANELDSEVKRRRLKTYLQVLERSCQELKEGAATDEACAQKSSIQIICAIERVRVVQR